ncbi:Hypothetical predicted protein [Paramuricea clavata]|uniref:DUF6589 domain-containing protein n=1 Tax=Paramuricea clavata TaxID=317549 RepID=A0A6S7GT63_PARCT|nr:Hypothetical predicted protein [Paramuricea clavata]
MVLVQNKDGTHAGIAQGKVIKLVLPDGNIVAMQDKTPVRITVVLNSNEIKADQIVMWPSSMLAVRQPNIIPTPQSDIPPISKSDGVMNYSLQVLQLGFLLMNLNDTEKEGDGNKSLLNWKLLMLYFRCRSRGMKYAFEAMRFITMTKALYTARVAHRVIHGQFVNHKGGAGNNYANELKMEHIMRNNKDILKGLYTNKTLKASDIPTHSTAHTYADKQADEREIIHKIKPFTYQHGREYKSFNEIAKSPLEKLNIVMLSKWLTDHKKKLFQSLYTYVELENDEDDEDNDEDNYNDNNEDNVSDFELEINSDAGCY